MTKSPFEKSLGSLRELPAEIATITTRTKKTDVSEHPEVFDHVGLLVNGPPGTAGLPFIQSSDDFHCSAEPISKSLGLH